jgi:uncharacterized membrane protein YfcA
MSSFLQVVGVLLGALGVLMFLTIAESAIHEIEALFLLLIGAVFFCGGCIVDAIDKTKDPETKAPMFKLRKKSGI